MKSNHKLSLKLDRVSPALNCIILISWNEKGREVSKVYLATWNSQLTGIQTGVEENETMKENSLINKSLEIHEFNYENSATLFCEPVQIQDQFTL